MGTINAKHSKTTEDLGANQPRRRSIRRSLRFSKSSSKDALSSTEKFLQSLNEKFDAGIIYNMTLEELKNIETELRNILRDLDNLSAIGITSSKRFELENTARYFRNKIKAAIENHMDNAIQRLNDSFRIPETNGEEEERIASRNKQERRISMVGEIQLETDSAKIAVKLREISIKLREIFIFLCSLDEIDDVTRNSSLSNIEKCRRDLYKLQTKNDKLIGKKWKCFRRIDDITSLLDSKGITNSSKPPENTSEPEDAKEKSKREKFGEYEDDVRGTEADVEDNGNAYYSHTENKPSEKKEEAKKKLERTSDSEDSDKRNEMKLRTIKATLRNLHGFITSLEKVDDTTKASTDEALRNCKRELRSLRLGNAALLKKRTRRLKDIVELKAILHEKYCEASDGECNCSSSVVDSEQEKILKLLKPANDDSYHMNEIEETDDAPQRRNATIEVTSSKTDNEAFVIAKNLSENFDNTCKKITDILLRRSVSHDDVQILTERIGEINNQFDGLLKKINSLQEIRENNNQLIMRPPSEKQNEKDDEQEFRQEDNDVKYTLEERENDDEELKSDDVFISKEEMENQGYEENINVKNSEPDENSSKRSAVLGTSSPDLTTTELKAEPDELQIEDSIVEQRRRQSRPDKKYQQTHSVDELNTSEVVRSDYKRYSEQNLAKISTGSGNNLISMRNIDLSQIGSASGRISSTSEMQQETSVASRNLDLSQLVFGDSDIFLNRNEQNTFSHYERSSTVTTEDNSTEESGIAITFKSYNGAFTSKIELDDNLVEKEVSNQTDKETEDEIVKEQTDYEHSIVNIGGSDSVKAEVLSKNDPKRLKLQEMEKQLENLRDRIMNFVGVKTDNLYNELDEELLSVMINLDSLCIGKADPLYEAKEKIERNIFKCSGILETKNLDHQYLDAFEQEIHVVEREIRQYLAKEKFDNLRHVIVDVDDMLSEIENKIVDHLLLERRDNSIKRLNSIKDKLGYLTK